MVLICAVRKWKILGTFMEPVVSASLCDFLIKDVRNVTQYVRRRKRSSGSGGGCECGPDSFGLLVSRRRHPARNLFQSWNILWWHAGRRAEPGEPRPVSGRHGERERLAGDPGGYRGAGHDGRLVARIDCAGSAAAGGGQAEKPAGNFSRPASPLPGREPT